MASKTFKHQLLPACEIKSQTVNGKRFYTTPEGLIVPSVTTVLGRINAQAIQQWRERVGEVEANAIAARASSRGTKVHLIAEKYVLNDSDYAKDAMPVHKEMFKPLKQHLDETVNTIYGSEIGLYSTELMLAGRCDLVCDYKGRSTIVDFKTASKPKYEDSIQNYFMQVAAYAIMCNERHNTNIQHYAILISTEHEGLQVFEGTIDKPSSQLYQFLDEINHVQSVCSQQTSAC